MIRRIVGSNQVATPTEQMGTPPDIGKSQMGTPPEPIKSNEQIQSDAVITRSLQQSALEKAGDQRLQASRLQTELLTKLDASSHEENRVDPLRLMKETLVDPLHEGDHVDPLRLMKETLVDPPHEENRVDPPDPFEATTAKTNLPPPDSGIDMLNKL